MHYCVHLLTKKLPTKKEIEKIMEPYSESVIYGGNEDKDVKEPTFTWDWFQIGGRYSAYLKLKVDLGDEHYGWRWVFNEKRNGRLFWSMLLNVLEKNVKPSLIYREEEYFPCMGIRDGYILVDGAKQADILNIDEMDCFACVLADGSAIARESWNGDDWIKDEDFDKKYKKAIEDNMDGFLTVLDIHN